MSRLNIFYLSYIIYMLGLVLDLDLDLDPFQKRDVGLLFTFFQIPEKKLFFF